MTTALLIAGGAGLAACLVVLVVVRSAYRAGERRTAEAYATGLTDGKELADRTGRRPRRRS